MAFFKKNKAKAEKENNVNEVKEEKSETLDFTETENNTDKVTEDFTENTTEENTESSENTEQKPEDDIKSKEKAYFDEIEEKKKTDPLIAVKLCGRDIFNAFAKAGQDPDGKINCNAFLFNISAFAGYACQAAVWKKYVREQNMPVEEVFDIHKTEYDRDFYFSQYTNKYICEGQLSYWSLIASIIMQAFPGTKLPDVISMFEKVTLYTLDENYKIYKSVDPVISVEKTAVAWKNLYNMITKYCPNPDEWATAIGIAVQNAVNLSKEVVKPEVCFEIVMESTIYMSKSDISKTLNF